ncbi:MAG TPA: alpha/beta fold hydrolase [Polyangia bacterium]|jgi:pimeloyl-ACP methyl ester carboxylesterase
MTKLTMFVDGPAGRLHLDDGGTGGVPVLFVHGGGANLSQWAAQLAHLRASRRALAFDLRGMGQSDRPADGDYGLEAMAGDVLAVAAARRLGRFVLVAHSYGVAVACAFAGAHPDRLAGLVLVDGYGAKLVLSPEEERQMAEGFRPERYESFTASWFEPLLVNARPRTREAVLGSLRATPPEVFTRSLRQSIGFDPGAALARYPGPRLAIACAALDNPQMMQHAIPGIPCRMVEGVSHWIQLDAPDEVNAILDEFLAGL